MMEPVTWLDNLDQRDQEIKTPTNDSSKIHNYLPSWLSANEAEGLKGLFEKA